MALCYACGERHYETSCPVCDEPTSYRCWNCQAEVGPNRQDELGFHSPSMKCRACGWYRCIECEACGCDEERPNSREEQAGHRERHRLMTARELRLRHRIDQLTDQRDEARAQLATCQALLRTAERNLNRLHQRPRYGRGVTACPSCDGPKSQKAICRYPPR